MTRRLVLLLLVCLVGGAGVGVSQAVGADGTDDTAPPTQLWEEFPLGNGVATTPATTPATAVTPAGPSVTAASTSGGSVNGVDLLVLVLVALLALPMIALTVRGVVRRRHGAAQRVPQRGVRPSVAGQAGTLAPLAPAGGRRRRRGRREERFDDGDDADVPGDLVPWNPEDTQATREVPVDDDVFAAAEDLVTEDEPESVGDEPEPEPVAEEPEDEPEPVGDEPVEAHAAGALDPDGTITVQDHRERREERAPMPTIDHEHPSRTSLAIATTYEIVWYRADERLNFALQPVDGRIDPGARRRSGSFVWNQDNDPPSSLRTAQRAHGRLRARLLREGWTAAGRGTTWFSHRFHPPEDLSEPSPEDLPEDR